MAAVIGVGATGRYLGDLASHLVEQARQDFSVALDGGGHFKAEDILRGFVYTQMDLTLPATLADPVLTHPSTVGFAQPTDCGAEKQCFTQQPRLWPFAFAKALQASRINRHVCVGPLRGHRWISTERSPSRRDM